MSYSIYPSESLVLMFPYIYGGGSGDSRLVAEDKSKAVEALQQMPPQLAQQIVNAIGGISFYWGGTGGTSGPPYAGAIICFLALVGFFLIDKKHLGWMLAAIILTLFMSWGKYFEGFTGTLLDVLPMYNKFRAPSMILVIPTLLFCMLAVMALQVISTETDKKLLFSKFKKGLFLSGGILLVALIVYFSGDFSSEYPDGSLLKQIGGIKDLQQKEAVEAPIRSFVNGIREDRKDLFLTSLLRSIAFIVVAAGVCMLLIKNKLKPIVAITIIGFFAFVDVMMVDVKYFNAENYQDGAEYKAVFDPSSIDQEILKDTSNYRVLDLTQGISGAFNSGALTAYFHKAVGGYHPAKLSIYQDLIEKQLSNFPDCAPALNMLNTKYIILPPMKQGESISLQQNPDALGAAWFVKNVSAKKSYADVITDLTYLHPKDTALVLEKDMAGVSTASTNTDSTANISLLYNDNDIIEYKSHSASAGFAVFSEIYYEDGWVATIDEKETPIIRTNYVLRGLVVPAGDHRIKFEFKPSSIYNSSKAGIISSVFIWLLLIAAFVKAYKTRQSVDPS